VRVIKGAAFSSGQFTPYPGDLTPCTRWFYSVTLGEGVITAGLFHGRFSFQPGIHFVTRSHDDTDQPLCITLLSVGSLQTWNTGDVVALVPRQQILSITKNQCVVRLHPAANGGDLYILNLAVCSFFLKLLAANSGCHLLDVLMS